MQRAEEAVNPLDDRRFTAVKVDASKRDEVAELIDQSGADVVVNACDPRLNPPIFDACLASGAQYIDMAMHMSVPHPDDPYRQCGVKLGDAQFEVADLWRERGQLALVGMGVEAGLSDVFARYGADHLFEQIDTVDVRDGSNLTVEGYRFAPTFSVWTLIEECLNPPVIWERGRGWFTTEPFSEPELFDFPEGIGPLECVNVEHEEVLLVPRWIECNRVTFKYGLGAELISVLAMLRDLGLASTEPVMVADAEGRSVRVAPRDLVAATAPDPRKLGSAMQGITCAGTNLTGTVRTADGALRDRSVYLYHVVDNEWSMANYGQQAVVWQTAINPVVALELLAGGAWTGSGVLGPEAFPAEPYLDLLVDYGSPWSMRENPV
jgi:saccharopine dehydrogenase-like NADP-dependent oxidoreductase